MGWHYNDLDVYVSAVSDVLNETSYETENWFRVSQLGLIRSRPTITRSTNNAQKTTIPGKLGDQRSLVEQRSNAKIQIEILVADAWPFASLKTSQNTMLQTVLNRALYLEQVLNLAKRVAIKEQGHPTKEYYEVEDVAIEFNDADEKAAVLKCTMEVYPFVYDFASNTPIPIAAGASAVFHNELPYSECCPAYLINGSNGQNKYINLSASRNNTVIHTASLHLKSNYPLTASVMVDTKKMQAYNYLNIATGGDADPMNKYLEGDYDQMRFPYNSTVTITNGTSDNIVVFMRKGLRI